MTATLELLAEGTDELAFGIEHEYRRMIGQRSFALVDHIQVVVGIDGDVVSGLPRILVGQFREQVLAAKLEFTIANHILSRRSFTGDDCGRGGYDDRGRLQEGTPSEGSSHRWVGDK